jgi:hypothetical protein
MSTIKEETSENYWVKSDARIDYDERKKSRKGQQKAEFKELFAGINMPEEYTKGVKVQKLPCIYLIYSKNHSRYVEDVRKKYLAEENKRLSVKKDSNKIHIHEEPDDAYPLPCDSDFDNDIEIEHDSEDGEDGEENEQ